jgi:hypothetical protein
MRWLDSGDLLVEDHNKEDPEKSVIFRQVGWRGQTGRFYTMEENPAFHERGSFSPMYIQVAPD